MYPSRHSYVTATRGLGQLWAWRLLSVDWLKGRASQRDGTSRDEKWMWREEGELQRGMLLLTASSRFRSEFRPNSRCIRPRPSITSHSPSFRAQHRHHHHSQGIDMSCCHELSRKLDRYKICDTLMPAVKPTIEVSFLLLTKPIEYCFRSTPQTARPAQPGQRR